MKILQLLTSFFLCVIQIGSVCWAEDPLVDELARVVSSAGSMTCGAEVRDLGTGKVLFSHQSDVAFKPASVQKLITTAVALEELGPEFRFETDVSVLDRRGSSAQLLVLSAGADPTLTIEALWLIARAIRARGIERVGQVVLDDQQFAPVPPRKGQRAYETAAAGFAFNFNSVSVQICPREAGEDASVVIDPWEFGATLKGRIRTVAKGSSSVKVDEINSANFEVSGRVAAGSDCVVVYRSVGDARGYLGRVLPKVFAAAGVSIDRGVVWGKEPALAQRIYVHRSKALRDILIDLNHFSNNFIAQQIALVLDPAAGTAAGRRSLEQGIARIAGYLNTLGVSSPGIVVADASGLDHQNRVSAAAFGLVLQRIWDSPKIRAEFEASLSVAGRSGTLKNREIARAPGVVIRAKTGTIAGVSSLAGVVEGAGGRTLSFVILLNETSDKQRAIDFEDRFVRTVAKIVSVR